MMAKKIEGSFPKDSSTGSSTGSSTVSLGVFEQVKWERDVAIEQLKELGYGLGEKPRDDAVSREVVERLTEMKIKNPYSGMSHDRDVYRRAMNDAIKVVRDADAVSREVIEDIKAEINSLIKTCANDSYGKCIKSGLTSSLKVIDKHISGKEKE